MTRRTGRSDPAAEFGSALEALDGEQLRSIVRDALEALDERPRARLMDAVVARAARRGSGWTLGPARRDLARDVERFVDAARIAGAANPAEVDDLLRQASRAFLAGEVSTARDVLRDLLTPIANGDIDLGQFEMLEEVLTVDLEVSAVQYVVSVYLTTPPRQRPAAVFAALDEMVAVAPLDQPLAAMERHATEPLPEFERFLAQWLRFVERRARSRSAWESPWSGPAVWAREAAERLEGTAGLERLAKLVRHPEAYDAWCAALMDDARWEEARRAFTTAAAHAGTDAMWRGEFLDGAALAAQELAAEPMAGILEAAWRGAPSTTRLAGWLGADGPSPLTIRKRARAALRDRPRPAASKRVEGILHGKHRRHYAHAAALMAACAAVAPAAGREATATTDRWAEELRKRYARFTAFQAELRRFQPSAGRC